MKTLELILEREKQIRREDGDFGIKACKESVLRDVAWKKKSLFELLEEYYNRAKEDVFFNDAMVLACWELINGQK